jgi:L-2-hydroxyglutarate oxidase LhgO
VKRVRGKNVITCAGFYADRVASAAGGATDPKVVTFRGTYYQLKPEFKDVVRMNVYPVPSGGGIPVGVHFTPTVNERRGHQMIVGPGEVTHDASCFVCEPGPRGYVHGWPFSPTAIHPSPVPRRPPPPQARA